MISLEAQVHDAFLRLVNRQRVLLHRMLARHEIHPAQAMCLRVLSRDEGTTQREIAAALEISAPTVTRLLQRMERSALVERTQDPDDARQTVVRLTPAGAGLQSLVDHALTEFLDASLARLPAADLRELARLMTKWSELAEAHAACERGPDGTAAPHPPPHHDHPEHDHPEHDHHDHHRPEHFRPRDVPAGRPAEGAP